jgi:hypothetical protein
LIYFEREGEVKVDNLDILWAAGEKARPEAVAKLAGSGGGPAGVTNNFKPSLQAGDKPPSGVESLIPAIRPPFDKQPRPFDQYISPSAREEAEIAVT